MTSQKRNDVLKFTAVLRSESKMSDQDWRLGGGPIWIRSSFGKYACVYYKQPANRQEIYAALKGVRDIRTCVDKITELIGDDDLQHILREMKKYEPKLFAKFSK